MNRVVAGLVKHWQLKLLSIAFAVALWGFVASEEKEETVLTVPLVLTEIPAGTEVTAVGVEKVDVRVQGLRSVIGRLHERDVRAQVTLGQARTGEVVLRILPRDITVPRGAQVLRVTPPQVRVTLDAVTRSRVDVSARLSGVPAPGYRVVNVRVEPRQVEIRTTRPEAAIGRAIETRPVDIEGVQATVRREVELAAPAGVELTEGTRRVSVTVEVGPW